MQKKINLLIIGILIWIFMSKKKPVPNQLTKNFHIDEFRSKDGALFPEEVKYNLLELAQNLQVLRDYIGFPIYINSGYRSIEHNKAIGGVNNSFHTKGMASDIHVKEYTSKALAEMIEYLIKEGKMKQGGLGVYDSFVHYDIQGKKVRWHK
jgi:uncharacterized protein YcbK (DUF882 family)